MSKRRPCGSVRNTSPSCSLVIHLDEESKNLLTQAAELRHISMSDYVREVAIAQARRELRSGEEEIITLSPEAQLAFWKALNETPRLTEAQKRLGSMMREL